MYYGEVLICVNLDYFGCSSISNVIVLNSWAA